MWKDGNKRHFMWKDGNKKHFMWKDGNKNILCGKMEMKRHFMYGKMEIYVERWK